MGPTTKQRSGTKQRGVVSDLMNIDEYCMYVPVGAYVNKLLTVNPTLWALKIRYRTRYPFTEIQSPKADHPILDD